MAVEILLRTYSGPSLTIEDLAWLRARTTLPILLKGVVHPDDARRAVDLGVSGIVVSTPVVLLESGIRGGADMVKALAVGARAVLVGRPTSTALLSTVSAGSRR